MFKHIYQIYVYQHTYVFLKLISMDNYGIYIEKIFFFWFQSEDHVDPLHSNDKTVTVHCLWDNPQLHSEIGPPMYLIWKQNQPSSPLLKALLTDQTCLSRK